MNDNNPSEQLHITFTTEIVADSNSGWSSVVMENSASILGTGKAVKIGGMIDHHRFEATMLPIGEGTHMIPVKASIRKAIDKGIGNTVVITIDTRRT
jgi:hypothetical protein